MACFLVWGCWLRSGLLNSWLNLDQSLLNIVSALRVSCNIKYSLWRYSKEADERVKLIDRIHHGCSSHDHAVHSHQIVSSFGAYSRPVLDTLRFVNDDTVPVMVSPCRCASYLGRRTTCIQDQAKPISPLLCVERQSSAPPGASQTLFGFPSV